MTKWVTKKLGECLTRLCNGLTYDVEEKSGYMVTRIETISNDDIDYNRVGHIRTLPKQEYRIQKGDILFSHINSVKHIGKVAYFDDEQELYHGMNLLLMRFHESCDSKFFFYMLSSEEVRRRMRSLAKSAVNQASINTTELHNFPIFYPESLAEQRRIAGILSSADGAIAASEALIEKYRNIKRGLLATLLQPKEGWKKVKLGECCEVNPKTDLSALHSNDEIAFLKMEDVSNDGKITNCNYLKYCFLAKKGFTTFQNEDVIFAKITPCMENGKGALVRNIKSVVGMGSTEFHVLRAKENISIDFIYQISISKHFRLEAEMQMTGSAGQQRVPTAFLEEYEISVPYKNDQPDLAEQKRIAKILSSIDAKIVAEEKVVEKYKGVKKGLMEEMMKEK